LPPSDVAGSPLGRDRDEGWLKAVPREPRRERGFFVFA
jgi:hypothetical protein